MHGTTSTTSNTSLTVRVLREVTDLLKGAPLPAEKAPVTFGFYASEWPVQDQRALLTYLRDHGAQIKPSGSDYYVAAILPSGFAVKFARSSVGERRTVTREVEEYVILDPADAIAETEVPA